MPTPGLFDDVPEDEPEPVPPPESVVEDETEDEGGTRSLSELNEPDGNLPD